MAKRGGGVSAVGLRPPCKTQPTRYHPDCRATLNLFVAQQSKASCITEAVAGLIKASAK